jgi:hypothetical protein
MPLDEGIGITRVRPSTRHLGGKGNVLLQTVVVG